VDRITGTDELIQDLGRCWERHVRRGAFERAWEINDVILRSHAGRPCWHLPRHEQYVWNGAPLDGRRVLVRCYHGLGDTLQFIRYAPLIGARASEVIVWAQPRLLPLLRGMAGIDRCLPLHDGDVGIPYDVDVEVMELPYVFRTVIETIPAEVPYLRVGPAALMPSDRMKVGIIWRAGDWSPLRTVPFRVLAPLLALPVSWYVLQSECGLGEWPAGRGIVAGTNDLLELAQVMRSLDLVISIDSMPAHLAGALATPVWTLLPADADWRWMEGRDDSPWYPTMRLFRQKQRSEWEPVIARVTRKLNALIAGHSEAHHLHGPAVRI
jgi:hypothetical protein